MKNSTRELNPQCICNHDYQEHNPKCYICNCNKFSEVMKNEKVEIELKLLERIAEYYEFPLAVFFSTLKSFPNKTRNLVLRRKAEAYDKLKEVFEGGD